MKHKTEARNVRLQFYNWKLYKMFELWEFYDDDWTFIITVLASIWTPNRSLTKHY